MSTKRFSTCYCSGLEVRVILFLLSASCGELHSGWDGEPGTFVAQKKAAAESPDVWEVDSIEARDPAQLLRRWGPDGQWVYAGRWVSHPPLEFAVDLLGEAAVEECLAYFRQEPAGWHCRVDLGDCLSITIVAQGNVQLDLRPGLCEFGERTDWKLGAFPQ